MNIEQVILQVLNAHPLSNRNKIASFLKDYGRYGEGDSYVRCRNTPFENYLLPLINVQEMFEEDIQVPL